MAIKVASAAEVAAKWAEVTPQRQRFYQANTPGSASEWEANTAAAAPTYTAAIQAGNIGQRYAGGARGKAEKFARKVRDVGVNRFGQGVQAATQDMQSGIEPYLQTLAGLTLPRKGPAGDPGNYQKVQIVGEALHRKRLALLGAGS